MKYFLFLILVIMNCSCVEKTRTKKEKINIPHAGFENAKLAMCEVNTKIEKDVGHLKNICTMVYVEKSKSCIDYLTNKGEPQNLPVPNQAYVSLWSTQFEKTIKGSTVRFYQGEDLPYDDVMKIKARLTSSNFGDGKEFDFPSPHKVMYRLRPEIFQYQPHRAYANFANQIWGGGVLRGANAQEEIQMRQSNALPWIAEKTYAKSNTVSWCPSININSLDTDPVVIGLNIFIDFDNKGYGHKLWGLTPLEQQALFSPREEGVPIYSFAMAAEAYRGNEQYEFASLKKMYYVAVKAFYYTMLAQYHDEKPIWIHTGNWGAGEFNNSVKMMWAIQLLAFNTAHHIFNEKTGYHKKTSLGIFFEFDAYNDKTVDVLVEAFQEAKPFFDVDIPELVIELLWGKSMTDKSWQIGFKH